MNPGRVLKPRVCEIIWNVKQLYDANKTVFDERNQLPDRNLHTRTRYIRDVLIHEVLTGFGIPNPIEAANARERMHLLRQRTNIFWDLCSDVNETSERARKLAGDNVRRSTWMESLDDVYKRYLQGLIFV